MSSQCQGVSHLHVMTYLFDSPNALKFIITYSLQYEIPLGMKFSNLGHDLLFYVTT